MSDPPAEFADDALLLTGLRARQPRAFAECLRLYGGRMLSTARRLLRGEPDAEDAVQEAFLSAFQGIGRFEGNSQLGTWLHRIVVNVCLMKLRSRSRRPETSIDSLLPQFDDTGHVAGGVRAWNERPEDHLTRDETRALVWQSIDRLPEDYRTVLLLRDIEELDTEETAHLLGVTSGTVKTRLHRARQGLKTLLDPHFQ